MSEKMPNMDYDADEVIENFKAKFKWPSKDEVEVVVKPPKLGIICHIAQKRNLQFVHIYKNRQIF